MCVNFTYQRVIMGDSRASFRYKCAIVTLYTTLSSIIYSKIP